MVVIGVSSDRTGERFFHIAVPAFLAAIGFTLSAFMVSPIPGMIALTIAAIGDLGSRGPFWSLPSRFLTSSASAAGIALINTVGALGGFIGPYAVGLVKDATGSFTGGLLMLAALLFVSGIATLRMRTAPALAELPARGEPADFLSLNASERKRGPMSITGATTILGLIADPVVQARSPRWRTRCSSGAGRFGACVLRADARGRGRFGACVAALRHVRNFGGAIVSMPHKTAIVHLLDELTPEAQPGRARST